jgi:hypothetical protein
VNQTLRIPENASCAIQAAGSDVDGRAGIRHGPDRPAPQSGVRRDDEQDGPRPGDGVMTVAINPVHVTARIDPQLSRWLWLFKWLLVLPHLVVLGLLWIAFGALSVVPFVAILVTGRYPRTIFEFNLGVMRWS